MAFVITLQALLEIVVVVFWAFLLNGGPVSMACGMILASLGSVTLDLSLGEMAFQV